MISSFDRLSQLRVQDAMTRNVVVVTANSTIAEAADTLSENRITGAPVVDEHGRCIGILTGTDFIHCKAEELDDAEGRRVVCHTDPTGTYCIEEIRQDLVRNHMTPAVQSIDAECSLMKAARCMCDGHIHRLVVVDEIGKPVGVITSLDLVATLIAVVEEE